MSDFLYSSESKPHGMLSKCIRDIYHENPPEITEYHGDWGSLAVSRNLYNGFQPHENDEHLTVVIGGPVLTFRDNRFLTYNDPFAGTLSVYERIIEGSIKWDEDLSGPFVILLIDKIHRKIQCITDLMLFIPVYKHCSNGLVCLGTHVDALAKSAAQQHAIDKASLVDFIINSMVIHPYTMYQSIRQCTPAAIHYFQPSTSSFTELEPEVYWKPAVKSCYNNINEAALDLRNAITTYIYRATEGMDHVAQFLSGGEDSRAVAGLLPKNLKKDAFVFLDFMNREGNIARKISEKYGINLDVRFRKTKHYLNILPEASDLVGSGQQYLNAHTLGFHRDCQLDQYHAVFGGLLANAFLKGSDSEKTKWQRRLSIIYEIVVMDERHFQPFRHDLFNDEILLEIDKRHRDFRNHFRDKKNDSLHDWFLNWPRIMGEAHPGIAVNRRLFRSYEPFMSTEVVKIASKIPLSWKLNRKVYLLAMRPFLKPAQWVPHGKGWLPYYNWWTNLPVRIFISFYRRIGRLMGFIKGNHGSWGDRNKLLDSLDTTKVPLIFAKGMITLKSVITGDLDFGKLPRMQQFNLFQTFYLLDSITDKKNIEYFHAE